MWPHISSLSSLFLPTYLFLPSSAGRAGAGGAVVVGASRRQEGPLSLLAQRRRLRELRTATSSGDDEDGDEIAEREDAGRPTRVAERPPGAHRQAQGRRHRRRARVIPSRRRGSPFFLVPINYP